MDAAEIIAREEKRTRFLENMKKVKPGTALVLMAEMVFDIQDFQGTQNHMSTAMRKDMGDMKSELVKSLSKMKWALWGIMGLFALHILLTVPETIPLFEKLFKLLGVLIAGL